MPDRINVIGTSGSGKSTFAKEIAAAIDAPYIEMDALFWRPNWTETPDEEFLPAVEKALNLPKWVLDGNYSRTTPIKWKNADTVIWLDFSFPLTLYRAITRAIGRAASQREIWPNTGNRESFRKLLLNRDSIVLWTITTYRKNRRRYARMMQDPQFAHIQFVRIRTPSQARQYIASLSKKSGQGR